MIEPLKKVEDDSASIGIVTIDKVLQAIPSLAFVHPDTVFHLYREYKPMRDVIEYTIFYREPGRDKFRIDAEVDGQTLGNGTDIGPHNLRIVSWRKNERS